MQVYRVKSLLEGEYINLTHDHIDFYDDVESERHNSMFHDQEDIKKDVLTVSYPNETRIVADKFNDDGVLPEEQDGVCYFVKKEVAEMNMNRKDLLFVDNSNLCSFHKNERFVIE